MFFKNLWNFTVECASSGYINIKVAIIIILFLQAERIISHMDKFPFSSGDYTLFNRHAGLYELPSYYNSLDLFLLIGRLFFC